MDALQQELIDILQCPICHGPAIDSIVLSCGHHLCQTCSLRLDMQSERDRDAHQLNIDSLLFSCPICRHKCILQHSERPKNYAIDSVLQCLCAHNASFKDEYTKVKIMKVEENDEEEYIPTAFIDLDALIEQEQERLIQITLNIILKRLYESARAGRNLLVIQDDMVYNAFTVAGQKLSRILFDRCSLYSVCLTSQRTHEVVFYLNADARTDSITRQFTRMEE